jgi:CubicO group peptidase (beta-lactamase class C family)
VHTDNVSGLHELRAVLVSVDGEVVAERYYGSDPAEYADLQSVTKSIVSILAGIAIGEGKISGVDATLEDLLPEHRKDMDGRTKRTTLRQLLTMTAGWTDSTPPANRDLLRAWFREGPELQPGAVPVHQHRSAHRGARLETSNWHVAARLRAAEAV